MKLFVSLVLLSAAWLHAESACPREGGYKVLGTRCVRATENMVQSKALTKACILPFEEMLTGEDATEFHAAKKLFLAAGNGQGNPGTGAGGPGKFFWLAARADLPGAPQSYNFPSGAAASTPYVPNGPGCLAAWSRSSSEFYPADCGAFYRAICARPHLQLQSLDNKAEWTASASSFQVSVNHPENLYTPDFAINGELNRPRQHAFFYHSDQSDRPYPYLQIDLGSNYLVGSVLVQGRTDCCAERFAYYEARVGNVDSLAVEGTDVHLSANPACGADSGPGPRTEYTYDCGPSGLSGRFLTVQSTANNNCEIGEVSVSILV